MAEEALNALNPQPNGRYADGTVGGAGHAERILTASSPTGWLYGCDRDGAAVEAANRRLGLGWFHGSPEGGSRKGVGRLVMVSSLGLLTMTLLGLLLQGPYSAGTGLSQLLRGPLVRSTLQGGLGPASEARELLSLLAAGVADFLLPRLPTATLRFRRAAGALWALLMTAMAATWAVYDHAATGVQAPWGIPDDIVHLDAMALEHVTRKRDKQLKGADAYNAVKLETMRQHYIRFCEDNPSARWKGVAPLAMMVSNYLAKQGIQDFGTETCRKLLKWVVGSLSAWDQTTASWRYEPLPGPAKRRGK